MRCDIYEDAIKEYGLGPNNEILQAAVRNQLERTGHSLEFHPAERVGLVSGRIRRLIKKAFHIFLSVPCSRDTHFYCSKAGPA